MNKREFVLGTCALACAATAAAGESPRARRSQLPRQLPRRLPDLSRGTGRSWQAYLNQSFDIGDGMSRQQLMLKQVRASGQSGHAEQFTLGFDGPATHALGSRIQTLRHASGQRLALYLEPAGAGESAASVRYLAHFNLLA